jgi:VanZ family protein
MNSRRLTTFDILAIIAFLAALWSLFFLSPPRNIRSIHYLWNSGHVALFFLFCHVFYLLKPRLRESPFSSQIVLLLSLSAGIGTLIEIMQLFMTGREASLIDIVADLTGALFYLSFRVVRRTTYFAVILRTSAIILMAVVLFPAATAFLDERTAALQFPVLADFESPLEKSRFKGKATIAVSSLYAFSGQYSLRLNTTTEKYSGTSLDYFPRDWSSFQTLSFACYNPQMFSINLYTRIHDTLHAQGEMQYSDRYNHRFSLQPGWNELQIPLSAVRSAPENRLMDMSRIEAVGFFVKEEPAPLVLYLDTISLH